MKKTKIMEIVIGKEKASKLTQEETESKFPEAARKFEEALRTLDPTEEKILKLRCGYPDGQEASLLDVSKELGITREKARQTEEAAIAKIRALLNV